MTDTASEATTFNPLTPWQQHEVYPSQIHDTSGKCVVDVCSPYSYTKDNDLAAFIVEAVNAYDSLKARLAEVEHKLGFHQAWQIHYEKRALAAEARIAVLEPLLIDLIGGFPSSEVLRHAAAKSQCFIVCHPDSTRIYAIRSEDVMKAAALAEQKGTEG